MPRFKFLDWGALAVAAAGSLGCMGGGTSPMASSASAGKNQPFAQQTATPNSLAATGTAGAAAGGGISQALWDNPVSRAVKGAFGDDVQSASHVQTATTVSPSDPLSLSKPSKPLSPELYTSMGLMAERAGNVEKAREFYEQGISRAPGNADVLLAYGHFHDRQGQMGEATRLYREAIAADPQHAGAHNDLGLCYARQGHLQQALELVRHAAQLRPDRPIYRNNAAKVLVEMGRSEDAVSELATVLSPAEAEYNVGCFLAQSGRNEAAAGHFAKALQIEPNMQNARAWLAKLQPAQRPASQTARANVSPLPPAQAATTVGAYAGNSYSSYSPPAGRAEHPLPLITNVRPAGTAGPNSPEVRSGVTPLPSPTAGSAYQQQASYVDASSAPPQQTMQTSAWPPSSATVADPYASASEERYQVPNPVASTGWPAAAGDPATGPSHSASQPPSFDGASHQTPWGDVPSPYGETSYQPGLQYPSTSGAAAPGTAAPTSVATAPSTVVNPYAAAPTLQQRVVRQRSGSTMQ